MSNLRLITSIINYLRGECDKFELTDDTRESLEVAVQCLQTAYDLKPEDLCNPALQPKKSLVDIFNAGIKELGVTQPEISSENRAEADEYKNLGNTLMKSEKHSEAVDAYTKAISLDGSNAVYYCNRAAAFSRMADYLSAIKDCEQAISLDCKYSKAYGRMGLAYVSLGNHERAVECYKTAAELDPSNESYGLNLRLAKEQANKGAHSSNSGVAGSNSVDVNELFNNPVLRNMATTMMQDPNMFNILSGLVSSSMSESGNGANVGMDALLQAGQQFAAQMQASNPQLVEQLRQQVLGNQNPQNSENQDPTSN